MNLLLSWFHKSRLRRVEELARTLGQDLEPGLTDLLSGEKERRVARLLMAAALRAAAWVVPSASVVAALGFFASI